LAHAVAPGLLYATNYTYLSGVGASFVRHFAEYAAWAAKTCDLPGGALVVDVGSNDGTCLAAFKKLGFNVCGVDPASMPAALANSAGIDTLNRFFDDVAVEEIVDRFGQADFVTSHNVLAHVDDLAATFRRIHALLKEGGFFAFEVGYFREVLEKGCFDTIYHEHLSYFALTPLMRLFTDHGLRPIKVKRVDVGASGPALRLFVCKDQSSHATDTSIAQLLGDERDWGVCKLETYSKFAERVAALRDQLLVAIRRLNASGNTVGGYGAPAKGNTMLNYLGLTTADLVAVAENSPLKIGKLTPGTHLPVMADEEFLKLGISHALLLTWNYADYFLANSAFIKQGGKFVLPFPNVTILPE
jgi:SAM-dependent methyltransferase